MDAFKSSMLGHIYFTSPDYLVVQWQLRSMLLYLINTVLEKPNVYQYFKFFPGMVMHFHSGSTAVLCNQIVAIFHVTNCLAMTAFAIP